MAPAEPLLHVQVVYGPQGAPVAVVDLQLPTGSTAQAALLASGLPSRFGLQPTEMRLGVWGKRCEPDRALRDRDRVEIYRPLLVDPKEARRQRYRSHRAKVADTAAEAVSGSRKR